MSKVQMQIWTLAAFSALTLVSVPMNAQELCMWCEDDITVVPGQGITEWTHYFPGSSGEGGYECEDANEYEQDASFASMETEEPRGELDHDGCHIDDGPGSCVGHRLCFGGSQSSLRAKAVEDMDRAIRRAEATFGTSLPEGQVQQVQLVAIVSSSMNFSLSSTGLLTFSDCDGSVIASWRLSHDLAAMLQVKSSLGSERDPTS